MSRIGIKSIAIPENVTVKVVKSNICISGNLGEMNYSFTNYVNIIVFC